MTSVLGIFIGGLLVLSLFGAVVNLLVRSGTLPGLLAVQLVAAVIQAALVPFFNAGFVSTYFDLKLRAQKPDLAARVGAFGNP
jgi:hypothetical protein